MFRSHCTTIARGNSHDLEKLASVDTFLYLGFYSGQDLLGTMCRRISSNGMAEGIVWALRTENYSTVGGHATLHAFAADDLHEIYNSNKAGTRDLPGGSVKFTVPTVANGKVYVGTQSTLDVFGLMK